MKQPYFFVTILCSVGLFLLSCSASRSHSAAPIGLVQLGQYLLVNNNTTQDTLFKATRDQADFTSTFAPKNSAEKLDLYGKIAVAIVVKNPSALYFERAESFGSKLHVYARSCETSQPNCSTGTVFLATIPNVSDAKSVHFFINNYNSGQVQL